MKLAKSRDYSRLTAWEDRHSCQALLGYPIRCTLPAVRAGEVQGMDARSLSCAVVDDPWLVLCSDVVMLEMVRLRFVERKAPR
jgi:hypothetical protein